MPILIERHRMGGRYLRRSPLRAARGTWSMRITVAVALALGTSWALAGETESGVDPFRTENALKRMVPGLTDPLGYDCATPGRDLTFAAAVDLALCANPQARSAWAQAHQQAATLGQADSAWVPQVTLDGSQERQFGGEHVDNNGNTVSTAVNTTDAAVSLSWVIYDFGGRTGRIESAHRLLDAAASSASSVVQQTVRSVVQTYYGAVAGDASVEAARSTAEISKHSLEIARALQTGGVGTVGDVLQAQTAYEQAALALVQATAAARTAQGALAVALGRPADLSFRLAPDPVPAEAPSLGAHMNALMREAMRQRPDLAAARYQRDAAEANIGVARSAGWPTISLGVQHHYTRQTDVQTQSYNEVGVSVTWPIFTGFNVNYGVRQAESALHVSEENLRQVELNVSQDVWSGYYNLESAIEQLGGTTELLKTAEENEKVSIGRYQAGVGSIVDVLTAQAALSAAREARIAAELGWNVARAQLAYALGRLSSAAPLAVEQSLPQ